MEKVPQTLHSCKRAIVFSESRAEDSAFGKLLKETKHPLGFFEESDDMVLHFSIHVLVIVGKRRGLLLTKLSLVGFGY